MTRLLRRPIAWVFAPERSASGMWHVHVIVVGGVGRNELNAPRAMWQARNGIVDIRRVTASAGLVLYTTKQAATSGEIVLSDTLVRYRDCLANTPRLALHPQAIEAGSRDELENG